MGSGAISSLLIFVAISGCGSHKKKQTDDLIDGFSDSQFATNYFLEDVDCQERTRRVDIDSAFVHRWQGDTSSPTSVEFEETASQASVRNSLINATMYGFHQRKDCEEREGPNCTGKAEIVRPPLLLRVCRSGHSFKRESVEGVALASLANLNVAQRYYQTLTNKTSRMKKTTLLVLPTVEEFRQEGTKRKRKVLTDNLAYAPSFGSQPAFVIFPKGRTAIEHGLWREVNLWEIPWALAHEFGHHVMATHAETKEILTLSEAMPIHDFRVTRPPSRHLGLMTRRVGPKEMFAAVNEAFADLFAFYTLGAKAGLTDGLDCFEINRDVAVPHFYTGRLKAYDSEVKKAFFSTEQRRASGCRKPSFQDSHILGAIFAHGIHKLFMHSLSPPGELLLAWANKIGLMLEQEAKESLTFSDFIAGAIETVAPDGNLNHEQCQTIHGVFPALVPELLTEYRCQ